MKTLRVSLSLRMIQEGLRVMMAGGRLTPLLPLLGQSRRLKWRCQRHLSPALVLVPVSRLAVTLLSKVVLWVPQEMV